MDKTSDPHRLLLNFLGKIRLKRIDKYVASASFSIYYTFKNIKMSNKSHEFKISTPTWDEKFELSDGSYPLSDIQDHF